jgi:putative ABC transport system permease protein
VTTESILLGLLSGLLGSGLAVAGVWAVNHLVSEFRLDLTWDLLLFSNLAAITIAALSGLYPAWRASRMTPMNAIRMTG